MDSFVLQGYVFVVLSFQDVYANSTSTDTSSSSTGDAGLKVLITFSALAAMFILSFLIAKLFDICYEKHTVADKSTEEVSDHTRDLIRARLSVIQFKRKNITPRQKTLNFLRRWAARARIRTSQRQQAPMPKRSALADKKIVIKVGEADKPTVTIQPSTLVKSAGATDVIVNQKADEMKADGSPKTPHSPSSTNTLPSNTDKVSSRPVSSRSRAVKTPIMVNVTASNLTNSQKSAVKSVHFEDETKPDVRRANSSLSSTTRPSSSRASASVVAVTPLEKADDK